MDADLEPIYLKITQADHPEDVFGYEDIVLPVETLLTYLGKEYDQLAAALKPEAYRYPEDVEAATEAKELLEEFYAEGQRRIQGMRYGLPGYGTLPNSQRRSFRLGDQTYYIGEKFGAGAHTGLYRGFLQERDAHLGEVVIKLADTPEQNGRLRREVDVLGVLHEVAVPQWRHLPYVLDSFRAGERQGVVMRKINAFTMTEVRKHREHAGGVDQKHLVWMLDRSLSALGYIHSQGVVHGTLVPDHLMIQPAVHNVFIAGGWGGAVHEPAKSGERVDEVFAAFSAPEVLEGGPLGPWTDIYSLGKLAIWLLGGDPVENRIPKSVEKALSGFILDLVEDRIERRPQDAWELFELQCEIKDSLWPRKFLHFNMA